MPTILPPNALVREKVQRHGLAKKFQKQCTLLTQNVSHPSLHVELLEPRDEGVYSFRLDRKYRALFVFIPEKDALEIVAITVHYQ